MYFTKEFSIILTFKCAYKTILWFHCPNYEYYLASEGRIPDGINAYGFTCYNVPESFGGHKIVHSYKRAELDNLLVNPYSNNLYFSLKLASNPYLLNYNDVMQGAAAEGVVHVGEKLDTQYVESGEIAISAGLGYIASKYPTATALAILVGEGLTQAQIQKAVSTGVKDIIKDNENNNKKNNNDRWVNN